MLIGPALIFASLVSQALAQTGSGVDPTAAGGPTLDYFLTLGPYGALVWGAYLLGKGVKLTIQVELSERDRELLTKVTGKTTP
ncbi:MAG: hypothetical protein IPI35_24730 [Deltaproteobacteria bacterium]|nr:hypothetical protein [Deltaproteobacteria bacterium]